jgi:hypothetical protein
VLEPYRPREGIADFLSPTSPGDELPGYGTNAPYLGLLSRIYLARLCSAGIYVREKKLRNNAFTQPGSECLAFPVKS